MRHRIPWAVGLLAVSAFAPHATATPAPPAAGQSLPELLRDIATPAGARFRVAPEVARDRIQARPAAGDWPAPLRELLRGYNYAATWTAQGRLAEINVTGRNGDGSPPPAATPPTDAALFSYRPPAKRLPATYFGYAPGSVHPIKVPIQRLRGMKKGERIAVNLPDGRYQLVHDNDWRHGNGDQTWVGYLDGQGNRYRALLTLGDNGLAGQITTPGGLYKLDSDETGDWLVDMNASGLQPGTLEGDALNPAGVVISSGAGVTPPSAAANTAPDTRLTDHSGTPQPTDASFTTEGKTALDVLLLYTPGMADPKLPTRLNHLLALTNQALADSQVNAVMRLAAIRRTAYRDGGDNSVALNNLTFFNRGFANVPRMRWSKGADIVMLVRPFKPISQGNNCGTAWINGSDDTPLTADLAFGVVGYGANNGFYCSDYTLAHELGHSLGAAHDRQHASVPGKFPYSYGYGIPGRFGDIMSYYDPEMPYYANPDISQCDGLPCGVAVGGPDAADVALTFNQTAATVSGFVRSVLP